MMEMNLMENAAWEYSREVYDDGCTEAERAKRTEEILDFANMVFSVEYGSTDFASLLPKAYSPERSGIPIHHMIREDSRIKALIDLYPVEMRLQGEEDVLRAAYVGTVCVHPNARGRGYMTELMQKAEEDARRQGCALMILDGERHRYQNYGFERAGARLDFRIEMGNVRHCCARFYKEGYMASKVFRFEELTKDSPYFDSLYDIYQQKKMTARPREDFWLCLQSYHAYTYVILRYSEVVGYLCFSEDGQTLAEYEIIEPWDICRILYDLMTEYGIEQFRVSAGMDEDLKITELNRICDSCSIAMSHQIKILDHEAVLGFLLKWKQKYSVLGAGDYVIGVRDTWTDDPEKYLLSVTEDHASVSRTEREADIVFGKLELVQFLMSSHCYVEQRVWEWNKIKNAPAGWFPLPFYLPQADTF